LLRKIEIAALSYEKAKKALGYPDFPSFEEYIIDKKASLEAQ